MSGAAMLLVLRKAMCIVRIGQRRKKPQRKKRFFYLENLIRFFWLKMNDRNSLERKGMLRREKYYRVCTIIQR